MEGRVDKSIRRGPGSRDGAAARAVPAKDRPAYNVRILWPLFRWLRVCHGEEAFTRVARAAGLDWPSALRGSSWITPRELEAALQAAYAYAGDDETFKAACGYRLHELYGPWKFVTLAAGPRRMYAKGIRLFHYVSRVSRYEMEVLGPRTFRLRYVTGVPESHLVCLSRQASLEAAPRMLGLPPARIAHRRCVAAGAPDCVYDIQVARPQKWLPAAAGALAGSVGAAGLLARGHGWPAFLLPVVGTIAGHVHRIHRAERACRRITAEATRTLERLVREEAEARLEAEALHARQSRWTRLVEEELSARTAAMEKSVEGIRRLTEERVERLRGVSHDIGNPLQMLALTTDLLAESETDPAVVADVRAAVDRIRALLDALMQSLSEDGFGPELRHEALNVRSLAAALERRMRALAVDRDVRVAVSTSRRAPPTILADRFLVDRVFDNLLTNAAKYTASGAVTIRLTGTPGDLIVVVRDTGRGIPSHALERIFRPGGSVPVARADRSHGVGLSVVVSLLDRVGGRLEVESTPGLGSTFRVFLPVRPTREAGTRGDGRGALQRVVTVLPPSGAPGP